MNYIVLSIQKVNLFISMGETKIVLLQLKELFMLDLYFLNIHSTCQHYLFLNWKFIEYVTEIGLEH